MTVYIAPPLVAVMLALPAVAQQPENKDFRQSRERMVQQLMVYGIHDRTTLAAMRAVPRHEFVPPEYRGQAYDDNPLPIGHEQTISQPAIVALMTELISPRKGKRVLEVGTGSGYQAAVLAETGCRVWSIEIFAALAEEARVRLARLGYSNVTVRHGDGYAGWPAEAPFDAVLVTAAADSVPPALVEQLAPGGRLVMPLGDPVKDQELIVIDKDAKGRLASRQILPVRFVPLLRGVR
jgi:protein-L-isoaspartate(D-aspartate) O-methyltransferase